MRIELHPEARHDFDEAFDWYAKRSVAVATRFAAEIDVAFEQIAANPSRFAKLDKQHHHCLLDRFPFHLVYRIAGKTIQVIAIVHGARRPKYWAER